MARIIKHGLGKVRRSIHDFNMNLAEAIAKRHLRIDQEDDDETRITIPNDTKHRYNSSAELTSGNEVKWHVDGSSYMYAVSIALEAAEKSIWILDWWLSPELYLRRPPSRNEAYRLDRMLLAAALRGVMINIVIYKEIPSTLTLLSSHTKHALENLHPNIRVFRHPDHSTGARSSRRPFLHRLHHDDTTNSKLREHNITRHNDITDNVIFYWAHHEKLCLIDGNIAFMGGLDLCFGRWDTNQHPITDAHPAGAEAIIFPGQDYNNARQMDFDNVAQWKENKLDRRKSPRMGWSDVSVSLLGPCVLDLQRLFIDRWNFIFDVKYRLKDIRCKDLSPVIPLFEIQPDAPMSCQIVRSCSKWSNGTSTERSIHNAYIDVIENSQHFVYIENQFFITATGAAQKPVMNQIGKALVDRILRAARAGDEYKVVVLIPSVPGFAGDLRDDSSLGTRAILEFQYNSISRGKHSIMARIAAEGFDPKVYIRFYNLRNYDRINADATLDLAQDLSSTEHKHRNFQRLHFGSTFRSGLASLKHYAPASVSESISSDTRYKDTSIQRSFKAQETTSRTQWSSVSGSYMLDGTDLRDIPWSAPCGASEIDAFVSEELYIHSKVLIADDQTVICGSANLNDRSQLGYHDSEIAIVVRDSTSVASSMAGKSWQASAFAASLRRQLYRKHLGLLRPRDGQKLDPNSEPVGVPCEYDWGCPEDDLVADPLSVDLLQLWDSQAQKNTDVFRRVFHVVPDDNIRNWNDYKKFTRCFNHGSPKERTAPGHVVKGNFSPGVTGATEVKDLLSQVKGTLVDMPLNFLLDEDVAKSGFMLNAFTEWIYT